MRTHGAQTGLDLELGKIISSGGISAGIDMALTVVGRVALGWIAGWMCLSRRAFSAMLLEHLRLLITTPQRRTAGLNQE